MREQKNSVNRKLQQIWISHTKEVLNEQSKRGKYYHEYTKLGNSDLQVSCICMGCMGFGDASNGQHSWTIDEEHSRQIIKRGLELGINFFDTAVGYQNGTSEQYLGRRALKDFTKRDDVIVATKFLPRTPEEIETGVTGQKHVGDHIGQKSGASGNGLCRFVYLSYVGL